MDLTGNLHRSLVLLLALSIAPIGCDALRAIVAHTSEEKVANQNVSILVTPEERASALTRLSSNYDYHVVVIGAVWCPPCDKLKFHISEHAREYPRVEFLIFELPDDEKMLDSDRAALMFLRGNSGCRGLPYIYVLNANGRFAESLCRWILPLGAQAAGTPPGVSAGWDSGASPGAPVGGALPGTSADRSSGAPPGAPVGGALPGTSADRSSGAPPGAPVGGAPPGTSADRSSGPSVAAPGWGELRTALNMLMSQPPPPLDTQVAPTKAPPTIPGKKSPKSPQRSSPPVGSTAAPQNTNVVPPSTPQPAATMTSEPKLEL